MPTGPADTTPAARPALPGRRAELERIEKELARARDGEARFIVLTGEAGVGKTRLLREVARRPDMLALGLHLAPERLAPEDLIEEWLGPVLRGGRRHLEPRDVALAAAAYPRLADLSPVAARATPSPVPPRRALAAAARLMAHAAERRPLLLLADDLPRLAPEVRALAAELAAALAGARVAVLATARREEGDPSEDRALRPLLEPHLLSLIEVRPLDEAGLADLVAAELDAGIDAGIAADLLPWLQAKSRGNPLFAVELIRALQGQGALFVERTSRAWRLAGKLDHVHLPETIAHVLDARRRALPPDLAGHLPALALLGADAPAALLAPALGITEEAVGEVRRRLTRAGVLELDRARSVHAFVHPLMAERWREALAPAERRRLASEALELVRGAVRGREGSLPGLEPGSCATGLEEARDEELPRLLAYAGTAELPAAHVLAALELGWRRLRAERPREGVGWARRATRTLREVGDPEAARWLRGQLDFLMGSALGAASRLGGAERRLRRFIATPEAHDPAPRTSVFTRLGLNLIQQGRLAEARQVLVRGIEVVAGREDARPRIYRAILVRYLAWIDIESGRFDAAEAGLARVHADLADLVSIPRGADTRDGVLHDLAALAARRGEIRQAIASLQQLVDTQRESPRGRPDSLANLAFNLAAAGELGRARTAAVAAFREASRFENRFVAGAAATSLGLAEATAGRWAEAIQAYTRAQALAAQTGHRTVWFFATGELGRAHAAAGDGGASGHAFDEALCGGPGAAAPTGESLLHIHWARAWALCRRGEWEAALEASRQALAAAGHGATLREHAMIELAAVEAEARQRAGAGLSMASRDRERLAARLAAIEPYLRQQELHGELIELARLRLHLRLLGWEGMPAEELAAEIRTRVAAMEAPARWEEIARELAGTPVAAIISTPAARAARAARPAPGAVPAAVELLEPAPPPGRLRLRSLGRLEVTRAGESEPLTRSDWGSRKARLLLAYLLAEDLEGRGVTREALCDAVWPDSDSLTLDRTFRVTMTFLRKALGQAPHPGSRLIEFKQGLYRLVSGDVWCDAREVERLLRESAAAMRAGRAADALEARRRAFDLYQGEFLADFDEIWIEPRRERYRSRMVAIGGALAGAALAANRHDEAQEVAERLVSCDPLSEEGHRLLIRVHLAAGRRDAAARQLERCRAILAGELGLEVSEETSSLLEAPARRR